MIIVKSWRQGRAAVSCSGVIPAVVFGSLISPVTAVTAGPVIVGSGIEHNHLQNSASALWTVAHNLGKRPDVEITSVGGLTVARPEILHLNSNTLTITFDEPFAGQAYCH